MDPAFARGGVRAQNIGDLSEPVLSQFGWHVIRLDGKRRGGPQALREARDHDPGRARKQRYLDEKREAAVAAIRRDPKTQIEPRRGRTR